MESVKLIECFNTWQGEGPDRGKSVLLLRFKYCNKNCPWCDTKVKMRVTPEAEYKIKDLQEIIDDTYCGLMITGGEPTFGKHLDDSINLLKTLKYPFANVESNGYELRKLIYSLPEKITNINFIYSPKIFTKEDLVQARSETDHILWKDRVFLKIVYDGNEFVQQYIEWLSKTSFSSDIHQRVYLMPEGKTREELLKNAAEVFDQCEEWRFNFSSRDHIIYGFL